MHRKVATDPIGLGFVASLARPGGNITGVTTQSTELMPKRLQLLKEAVPNLSRVAVLWEPEPGRRETASEAEAAARALGVQVQLVETRSPSELDSAFAAMTRTGAGAVLVLGSTMVMGHRVQIAEVAAKSRLPTMCVAVEYVKAGCLMSYSTSFGERYRRAAYYVDRILKGAKAADLPVEHPRGSSWSSI